MFKCQRCGTQQQAGVKPVVVVAEKRDVEYKTPQGQVIGKGWEIVREARLGPCCSGR